MGETKFFVHEKALCESPHVGEGTRVWGFSHVLKDARIGKNCNLGEQVFVENKVVIGNGCTIKNSISIWDLVTLEDNVFVGPSVVFTNDLRPRAFIKRGADALLPTFLKQGCTIGANATIVCGVTIGEYAMIGAGSVVSTDVPPHTLFIGNPGRAAGRVCFCGAKLDPRDYCRICQKPLSENSIQAFL
ncbi:MAG: N-acetyltransferase [Deltaproteobacteria bacterium]|nr:N-acetyltransferase [Deltaproteobacteria bacterium]MBI3294797.1 N-acetyltransferase [Deltaproteobacteria bacterium]